MANICEYEIKIKGKKENALKLIDWLRADYETNEDGSEVCYALEDNNLKREVDHHFYRVWELNIEYDNNNKSVALDEPITIHGYGDCAWSVQTCLIDAERNSKTKKSIGIERACKELNLDVEIFSEESGMAFIEHYFINSDGVLEENECIDTWYDNLEDFDTYEEYLNNIEEELVDYHYKELTKEEFDSFKERGIDWPVHSGKYTLDGELNYCWSI